MVVEYGQGMTALRGQREMTFEIHLPQLVRGAALKPLERPGGRGRGAQPAMPAHDRRDGTQRRHLQHPRIAQHPPDLARTPSRMVLAHRHHRRLAWHRRTPRLMVAPPRPILQTRRTFAAVTRHPLICDRRTDLVAPAQLANVGSRLQAKAHKLHTLIHHRLVPPGHGSLLAFSYWRSVHHVPERVSTMCPVQTPGRGLGCGF